MRTLFRSASLRLLSPFLQSTFLAVALACAMAMAQAATVTVSPLPAGGTVRSNVGGIVCGTGGSACTSANIAQGTTVTLTATPDAGYSFLRWTLGTSEITDNPFSFPMLFTPVTGSATFRGTAPVITSVDSATFGVLNPSVFQVTATGTPPPTFSVTAGSLPSGVSLSSLGYITGAPAAGTGGAYPITITASNGVPPNATQAFTFSVWQPPVITNVASATGVVGSPFTFTFTATGYPPPNFWTASPLPGLTLAPNGTLSGTPTTGGVWNIQVTAQGGGADATQDFVLTLEEAPHFTSAPSATFAIGSAGLFNVTATGLPAPTFSVTSGALPSGVTLSPAGALSGTPASGTVGTYPFTITAANGHLPNATQPFVLEVAATTAILGVEGLGKGTGSITSSPAGILCAPTCSASFGIGTVVTLTATAADGSRFAGWAGACGGTGTCTVTMDSNRSVAATFDLRPSYAAAMDLDGDGRSDMPYRNFSTGQVWRFLMNGINPEAGAMAWVEPDLGWRIVAEGDFNGDGKADLLWRNDSSGRFYFMPFGADGMPAGGNVIYTEVNPDWKVVHTPDLDGNGTADLLWWNSATGQVYAALLDRTSPPTGAVTVGAQGFVYTEPDTDWRIVAVGDFAGSGARNQLLWRHVTTGQVYLMTVTAWNGAFAWSGQMVFQEPNTAWKILGAADFNGDGRSDILWRNDSTGMVYMMLMNGPVIAGEAVVYTEPDMAWKIVAHGDYNGDGKADLLWRNDTTGWVYVMLMDGFTIWSEGVAFAEPDTAWRILGPWEFGQAIVPPADGGTGGKSIASAIRGAPLNRGMIGGWPVNPSRGIPAHR